MTGARQRRSALIDVQVALQSVAKRSSNPSSTDATSSEPAKPAAPPKDYSLKEGQTFTIKIPGRDGKKVGKEGGGSANLLGSDKPAAGGASGGGLFSLPPPPPPGRR